jgi:hypothetical protein
VDREPPKHSQRTILGVESYNIPVREPQRPSMNYFNVQRFPNSLELAQGPRVNQAQSWSQNPASLWHGMSTLKWCLVQPFMSMLNYAALINCLAHQTVSDHLIAGLWNRISSMDASSTGTTVWLLSQCQNRLQLPFALLDHFLWGESSPMWYRHSNSWMERYT